MRGSGPRITGEAIVTKSMRDPLKKGDSPETGGGFLENLKTAQVPASQLTLSSSDAPQIEIPSSLASARGWHFAPVLARSKDFPSRALAGSPMLDFVQVSQWWEQYFQSGMQSGCRDGSSIRPAHPWHLMTRLGVACCTISAATIGPGAPHCNSRTSWRFVCFHHSGQRLRAIGRTSREFDFTVAVAHLI